LEPIDEDAILQLRKPYYTTRELAFLVGCNRDTVRRRIRKGLFPGAALFGGSVGFLVPVRGVQAYLRGDALLPQGNHPSPRPVTSR
jgi:excisionase family DNA binding protein